MRTRGHRATRADSFFSAIHDATDERALADAMAKTHFALVQHLLSDPAALAALEEFLLSEDAGSLEARTAVGAMVAAGTPEVQAAMLRLLEARRGDPDFAQLMMPSMGFLAKPGPAIEEGLRAMTRAEIAPATRDTAALSLGILASRVAADDPARSGRIVDEYGARLTGSEDAAERATSFSVLGNAGTAHAGEILAQHVRDEDPATRSAAVSALRRVPTPAAEEALLAAVAEDPVAEVRASAAWALSYRTPSPAVVRAQADLIARERDPKIAGALLDNVWAARDADPDAVSSTLRRIADAHPSAEIQDRARALLGGS